MHDFPALPAGSRYAQVAAGVGLVGALVLRAATAWRPFGAGCAGTAGIPALDAVVDAGANRLGIATSNAGEMLVGAR